MKRAARGKRRERKWPLIAGVGGGLVLIGIAVTVFWHRLPPPPSIADPACRKAYLDFFAAEKTDLRVVFGYKDARPARFVSDRYERVALIEGLLKPCAGERRDCGFERSKEDGDLLVKRMKGLDGKAHRIELRVAASSAGPDDQENQADPFQRWKSAEARRAFLEGLKKADAVFYDGHSRDGGGPDFDPPRLGAYKHVDYDWYKRTKPGLREMTRALKEGKTPPKLVGLFSCVSSGLVPRGAVPEGIGWITHRRLLYFSDALDNLRDALSALLEMKCRAAFELSLQRQSGSNLSGFLNN